MPCPSTERRVATWKVALVLAALSTLVKLCLLLFPSRHVSPAWVFLEEQHRGNIAQEIIDGPLLPVQDYQHAPNVGGSVVVGILAVPFIALLGDSIAAVRMVPISFNALAVIMIVLILDRFVARRAAWIGGALLALAPPGYSLIAITAWGTHLENNALTLVCVYLFLALHEIGVAGGASSAREARTAFWFGLVAGFTLFFGYFFVVALITLLGFELVHDKLFFARRWARFALLGFAIGFTPWVTYNLACGFRGLSIYGAPVTERLSLANLIAGGWQRTLLLLGDLLPNSLYFKALSLGAERAAGISAMIVLLALAAALAWGCRRRVTAALRSLVSMRHRPRDLGPEVLFLAYVPVFVLGFAATNVGQGPIQSGIAHDGRYAAPLYPFLVLCAACSVDRAFDWAPKAALAVRAIPAALALVFTAGTLGVCDVSRAGESFAKRGTSGEQLAQWMAWTWRTDVRRMDLVVDGLQTRRAPRIADGMIFTIAQGLKWGIRFQNPNDPLAREKAHKNVLALRFLHDRVADAYKPYCEPPIQGEPFYNYRERDRFWLGYRHRQRAARCRDALALETPSP